MKLHYALPLLAAGCWDLPPGDQTSPYFWSDLFLDKYADQLVVGELEAGPAPLAEPRVVLLITGVTIKAQWFDPIVARLERDGFKPVVWEPPALLSGDLFEATTQLAEVVEQVRADSGQKRIDILAECTGGLIARHYIQSLGGDARVSRLVTFVSPQHGVAKAPLAAAIAGWPALDDLSPGSAFLEAVNSKPLPSNVPVTSIYTCTDEYIQPYETSIIPGATNIGLCDGTFVGHFQTFYDPSVYLIMHDALTAPLPGEAEASEGTEESAVEPTTGETDDETPVEPAPDEVAEPDTTGDGEAPSADDALPPGGTDDAPVPAGQDAPPADAPPADEVTQEDTTVDGAPAPQQGADAAQPPPQITVFGCTQGTPSASPGGLWWALGAVAAALRLTRRGASPDSRRP